MAAARATLTVLVLAAGQGTRMRSKRIKLLHPVAGRPMVVYALETARRLRPSRLVAVIGHQAEEVRAALSGFCDAFVLQTQQRGTGHAVLQAAAEVVGKVLLILNGDLPALRVSRLRAMLAAHRRSGAALTFVTAEVPNPSGYGRIVRDLRGRVVRIVEDRDASREEKTIREINCGIYCADPVKLIAALKSLRPNNAQKEYYLTDAVRRLIRKGEKVHGLRHPNSEEVLGVNTRAELARAGLALYARKAAELQEAGVTMLDPSRTWVDPRARIGRDSVIYPDVIIEGPSVLGEDCLVRSGCRLSDVKLGRGVDVRDHSVVQSSSLGDGASVGPFAHVRPGSVIGAEVRVGNFVEVKKSRLGRGTKASHLTYLGDADIGEHCNIGAGTITCNYDGETKSTTTLGRGVFIGSDTQLVAPVRLGDGAYVGAGTTVTRDVPSGALAISRSPQVNIDGWVERRKKGQGTRRARSSPA